MGVPVDHCSLYLLLPAADKLNRSLVSAVKCALNLLLHRMQAAAAGQLHPVHEMPGSRAGASLHGRGKNWREVFITQKRAEETRAAKRARGAA